MKTRRAIWKGIISFADARVPVKLYSAVEDVKVSFHLLHDQDQVRLQQQMVCEKEEKPVEKSEVVKGLEVEEHEYVLIEQEDLDALTPESDRTIEIRSFTHAEEIDGRYFERPYHLGPDTDPWKYASLAKALEESNAIGLCHWSFRKRSYSGALRARDGVLMLITLRVADEVASAKELDLPRVALSQRERNTARYLVDELTSEFDAEKYHNDFQDALNKLIETKARGGKVKTRRPKRHKETQPRELADILEASLSQARKEKGK